MLHVCCLLLDVDKMFLFPVAVLLFCGHKRLHQTQYLSFPSRLFNKISHNFKGFGTFSVTESFVYVCT